MARKKNSRRAVATKSKTPKVAEGYTHPDQTVLMRPEVGTQANFRKKKAPVTYHDDSSLSPALEWDGGNATTMKTEHRSGNDVPCWMLDSDYNNLCFRATQVFFPRTGAWESLKKIDDRGNELLVVRSRA